MPVPTPPDCNNTLEVRNAVCKNATDLSEMIALSDDGTLTTNYDAKPIALLVKEKFDSNIATRTGASYIWADETARNAQTGMVLDEQGYQTDNSTIYKYNGSAWVVYYSLDNILSDFADDVFAIYNAIDTTKKIAFDVSGVTTATTRTITMPDKDGTIAMTDDISSTISLVASSVLINTEQVASLTYTHDYYDDTTTTRNYSVGEYIADTTQGILYECILASTTGTLLTNATYFTAISSNTLTITSGVHNFTNGRDANGYVLSSEVFNGTIDFAGVSDGLKWVAKEEAGSYVFLDSKPIIVSETPTGAITEYQFDTITSKWYDLTGTALVTPISFLEYPVMVASGTPQYLDLNQKLSENVMGATTFSGVVDLSENRKVLEIGTIFNNNRYVVENPFGVDNWESCDVKLQFFINNRWHKAGESVISGTDDIGAIVDSLEEGIIIQTAQNNLFRNSISHNLNTSGINPGTILSAPARIIVTYIGETKDA